jgi:hypothetical protein
VSRRDPRHSLFLFPLFFIFFFVSFFSFFLTFFSVGMVLRWLAWRPARGARRYHPCLVASLALPPHLRRPRRYLVRNPMCETQKRCPSVLRFLLLLLTNSFGLDLSGKVAAYEL